LCRTDPDRPRVTRRRIVVTGASGNVGTALLLRLGTDDRFALHGVSRRPPAPAAPYSWAEWTGLDLGAAGAVGELTEVFRGADAVVHLAWRLQPFGDRDGMRRTNVEGTRAVVDAAIRAGVPHLVHQSSVGAYSPAGKRWVDESWPVDGIPGSSYSVDKAAAERIVDRAEATSTVVSRMRPGLIFQDAAASEVARYFLGHLVPRPTVGRRTARLAPISDALAFQVVHSADVADAIALVLAERAPGAFNVAADPVIDRAGWRAAFGGVGPVVPVPVLRGLAGLSYRLRLHPTEPGWVDLAEQSPLLRTDRLRDLGWQPSHPADDVLVRFVEAIGRRAGRPGPLLHRDGGAHRGTTAA
jgi:UDP-glucose 4-epimerase